MKRKYFIRAVALAVCTLLLASCGGGNDGSEFFESGGKPILADEAFVRDQQLVLAAAGSNTVTEEDAGRTGVIDVSNLDAGYVGVQVKAPTTAMFRVQKTDTGQTYDYAVETDGSWCFYPLSYGSGTYRFDIFLHIEGTSYETFMDHEANVTIGDEKAPFLVNNQIVDYGADSAVIQQAFALSANCSSDMEVIRQVFWWVCANIEYDTDKAANIASYGDKYVPDVDAILASQKGICYDYAAVAAAMLRANGIPTQLVMGNVNNGDGGTVYHAWNMVWTAETGWIGVKFEVKGGDWNRVDTTFAAADSSIAEFVGDGNNYYETSVH